MTFSPERHGSPAGAFSIAEILQTLGALVGGVVRVTTGTLTTNQRAEIFEAIATATAAVEKRDIHGAGAAGWALVDLFIAACANPYLVTATRDTLASLAHQLSATRDDSSPVWDTLDDGYPRLRDAIDEGDAIAAELAIETAFLL